MTSFTDADYTTARKPITDRLLSRMESTAEALPDCVARRDAKAVEVLLARKTWAELQTLVVILASWVARAEAAARESEAAA